MKLYNLINISSPKKITGCNSVYGKITFLSLYLFMEELGKPRKRSLLNGLRYSCQQPNTVSVGYM